MKNYLYDARTFLSSPESALLNGLEVKTLIPVQMLNDLLIILCMKHTNK